MEGLGINEVAADYAGAMPDMGRAELLGMRNGIVWKGRGKGMRAIHLSTSPSASIFLQVNLSF